MLDPLADDEQLAFKGVLVADVLALGDEHLAHDRLDLAGSGSQAGIVPGHVAPAEEGLAFFVHDAGHGGFGGGTTVGGLGQEHDTAGVLAFLGQVDAQFGGFGTQEGIGHLNQDAGAITQQRVITGSAAVVEVFQDQQTLFNDTVALLVLDMGNETDAAGILFVGRVVQALPPGNGPTRDNTIHHARVLFMN